MRSSVMVVAVAAATAVLASAAAPAGAVATLPVVIWELDEPAGATVMTDSGPNAVHGAIGAEVLTGFTFDGATGYDFERLQPNTPPARPQHNVTVPDHPQLDPGDRDFAITLRLRTTSKFGNIIQKGQGGTKGGRWKIEAPKGFVVCAFQGSYGYVETRSSVSIEDGAWHVVRCERTAKFVTITTDGVVTASIKRRTGTIDNTWPVSIGGKSDCDQLKVTCDYFPGDIDWIRIESS